MNRPSNGEISPSPFKLSSDASVFFRCLLDATSRPGTLISPGVSTECPTGFNNISYEIALTLCDIDTPIWLSESIATDLLQKHIHFHIGAEIVKQPFQAQFIFARLREYTCFVNQLSLGTDAYPDRSAILVLMVDFIGNKSTGESGNLSLEGPSIQNNCSISILPAEQQFWHWRQTLQHLFPLGVDIFLASDTSLISIPRSTQITFL